MITSEQLSILLSDLESDRIERTIATRDTDKFAQAICAFANDLPQHRQPGYLLLGVNDDGSLMGLKADDELLQRLGGIRADGNVLPQPVISIQKLSLPAGDVVVVEVMPADLPPVRYKGRVWIRVGARRAVANEQEERILAERRIAHAKSFDALPCLEAQINDLSEEKFVLGYRRKAIAEDVIAANHRPLKQQLSSLRFFDLTQDRPTHAGILLFCERATYFLAGAYIQFIRFAGSDGTSAVIDEKRIHGDLLTVLQTLDLLIDVNIHQHPQFVSTLREETRFDYPKMAIRELLANAIMHRDYQSNTPIRFYWFDDHIEITNPGGLYGECSEKNFPSINAYRNPVIAEALRVLGFVNRYGQGVLRAQKALETNANPQAVYRFDAFHVSVSITQSH
jgi:ATP-dependent DNA helicase RecG